MYFENECCRLVLSHCVCVCVCVYLSSLQDSILTQVQRIVKGEVSLAMKEQQAVVTSSIMQAMRSAAGTPIPTAHLDYQSQQAAILQLLQQGHLNQAFQQVSFAISNVYSTKLTRVQSAKVTQPSLRAHQLANRNLYLAILI